ncbi:MAG TPA: hypothetical protein VKB50_07790, partial [Vicinamibacterales bacterium]|nr:hypothetical protein [Vicinamibacterales bacterium]
MKHLSLLLGLATLACVGSSVRAQGSSTDLPLANASEPAAAQAVTEYSHARLDLDLAAIQMFRPEYPFWQHIFTIPDGRIAFGSAQDGRLLAIFPNVGDWARDGVWEEQGLNELLNGRTLPRDLDARRDEVVRLLTPVTGPLVHNPTRGEFLTPNARRYGSFLQEWGKIYERFGVPA